ncbi:MAG TPA: hypothetical protein PKL13_03980 [bacterium]|nr:hypothetical protein [bacterium]
MLNKNHLITILNAAIKNVIFYGIIAFVIKILYRNFELILLSKILSIVFIIIMLISLIFFIISLGSGLLSFFVNFHEKDIETQAEQKFLWAGTIIQLLENAICLYYSWYLYKLIF